jgi:predicted aldo/keto reductase-like oxidoreductase
MEYRKLPHGEEQISVISLGGGSLPEEVDKAVEIVSAAIDAGVNFFDLAPSYQPPFYAFAKAFAGRRGKVLTQMHFGAVYGNGKYGWPQDLGKIKEQIAWNFETLGTDYTDFGYLHCIDTHEDLDKSLAPGAVWEYMKLLKAEGKIRHLGFSSHEPGIARRLLETGLVDLFMFSINPAYDYQKGEYAKGEVAERLELYRDCEKSGVGISVMKPFAGGQLLDEKTSLFGRALTHTQCLQYALDRPAVLTVLPGVRSLEDLQTALHYVDSTPEERDYSVIGEFTPKSAEGICVYCNHCQPCPKSLNVGLINKYYDLAMAGDELAKGHYEKLPLHAGDCVKCGHCESRCPFHVKQEARMEEIARYFGK